MSRNPIAPRGGAGARPRVRPPGWIGIALAGLLLFGSPGMGAGLSNRAGADPPASTATYSVNFTENSFPVGVGWAVEVGTVVTTSNTTSLQVAEPNGTYVYNAWTLANRNDSVTGSFNVTGAAVHVAVPLAPVAPGAAAASPSPQGFPGFGPTGVLFAVALVLLIGVGAILGTAASRRRRSDGPVGPPAPGGGSPRAASDATAAPPVAPAEEDPLGHML